MRVDVLMLRVTLGILVLWALWALVDALLENFVSALSFGLVSPAVGLACLAFSVGALVRAVRLRWAKRYALAAAGLSLVIAVVPFATLPFDPS